MSDETHADQPLGASMPGGVRFVGVVGGSASGWSVEDAPHTADLDTCVACGLCLPHCPTYRVTRDETASPRGRLAAMRAVTAGESVPDAELTSYLDLCLVCRACEDVCPSHVPFGRVMERARAQVEPLRSRRARLTRWLGFHWVLPHPSLVRMLAATMPLARPFLSRRTRALLPRRTFPFARLPSTTEPPAGVPVRGTVSLLAGCAQDRWFHDVNEATIRVLTRNGWRVTVPRGQACCGALAAHNGRLEIARRLARRTRHAFATADVVVVNAAGCSAHMKSYEELDDGPPVPVRDLMEFLDERGLAAEPGALVETVAYHDACHAVRAQGIRAQPRRVLGHIRGLTLSEISDGDLCCGAAGIYNVTQPEMSDTLSRQKAEAVAATGARIVASANPGCTMQLAAGLRALGASVEVVHPIELLDRAYRVDNGELSTPESSYASSHEADPDA
jgi:glycolate oxidase iron-sulfur subunit